MCRLHKSIYGLWQSPRVWYEKLSIALLTFSFLISTFNSSLFYQKNRKICMFVLVHVGDIIITASSEEHKDLLIADLFEKFRLKDMDSLHCFLWMEFDKSTILETSCWHNKDTSSTYFDEQIWILLSLFLHLWYPQWN